MKVILLETMSHLGAVGDVVDVRSGYARNFLVPNGKASIASERNMKTAEHQKRIVEHKMERLKKASAELQKKLEKDGLTIKRKAGKDEKLFGSVTAIDIEESLRSAGIIVSRRGIQLDEPLKKAGSYKVAVKLDGGVEAKVSVEVVAESA